MTLHGGIARQRGLRCADQRGAERQQPVAVAGGAFGEQDDDLPFASRCASASLTSAVAFRRWRSMNMERCSVARKPTPARTPPRIWPRTTADAGSRSPGYRATKRDWTKRGSVRPRGAAALDHANVRTARRNSGEATSAGCGGSATRTVGPASAAGSSRGRKGRGPAGAQASAESPHAHPRRWEPRRARAGDRSPCSRAAGRSRPAAPRSRPIGIRSRRRSSRLIR